MSGAILPNPTEPAAAPQDAAELEALRAEIDRLDDALHATLLRRAEVVAAVAALHAKHANPLRPGREAAIIRRLLARHHGALPRHTIVRLWRELLAATTAMQGRFALAVCETDQGTDPGPSTIAIAREHFGALTPLARHNELGQALRAVSEGVATVAVLPMPAENERDAAAWWPALLHQQGARLSVVGRLPFWAPRPEGAPCAQALVVSAADPDPSGDDRSLLGLELAAEFDRGRLRAALAAAGFAPREIFLGRADAAPRARALVDVEGFVAGDDPRLLAIGPLPRPPLVLGAYAVPIEE